MGEPPADFKAKVQASILEEKRVQAEATARKEFERSKRDQPKKEKPKKDDADDADGEDKEEEEAEEKAEESVEEIIAKAREAVELTEVEKEQWFVKPGKDGCNGDLTFKELSASFSSFTLPAKEEGFDEIRYVWQNE